MLNPADLEIKCLGTPRLDSPIWATYRQAGSPANFVDDTARILVDCRTDKIIKTGLPLSELPTFEMAGARQKIFFAPSKVHAGIVTCGGLCPGINEVIRGLVLELTQRYDVKRISGFRYGYQGFISKYGHQTVDLANAKWVERIQGMGGTVLGTSRGNQSSEEIVDCLEQMGVNILFTIGGDGTQKGAQSIAAEIAMRGLKISVIGIPKTIDNDIPYLDKSFGFETAFSEAVKSVHCAHTEAEAAINGIGIVKLMGRESGFITCNTALATGVTNFVLIPEVPFQLEGQHGLLPMLKARLLRKQHACIVVAEGAGQDLIAGADQGTDASGNAKLKDIGFFLIQKMGEYLTQNGMEHTIKYIDPSYIIRSIPAAPKDSLYCVRLAQAAAHAGMSGRTEMVVGRWREQFVNLPMKLVTSGRNHIDPEGDVWLSVLEMTGQPMEMK